MFGICMINCFCKHAISCKQHIDDTSRFQIAVFKIRILLSFMSLSIKSQVYITDIMLSHLVPSLSKLVVATIFRNISYGISKLSGKYWPLNKLNICPDSTLSAHYCQFI